MAKKESSFLNMVLTLFIVTLIASTALGFVYEATKQPIEKAKFEQKSVAIKEVLPAFNNSPLQDVEIINIDNGEVKIYKAKKDEELVGVAIETYTNKGFSGNIKILVGFTTDGTLYDVAVLEHKETPGLGDKIKKTKSSFSSQFVGKKLSKLNLKVKKDGGDIDAITAATISSRAFCDAMDRALKVYKQEFEKNKSK